ncbi:MAG TPA: hypothetical protein VHD69_01710 [Candidatus Paceibacterota bacterium]|nr:hypothetical protein [Candidatus Paceibacterota bacterium]
MSKHPHILIFTGPFASGKTDLVKHYAENGFNRAITATTRPPRPDEEDGKDYYFQTRTAFENMGVCGELVESIAVNGHCYGTPRSSVLSPFYNRQSIVLSLDPCGALHFQDYGDEDIRRAVIAVYVDVGFALATKRARERPGGMPFDELKRRFATRKQEERLKPEFRHIVHNDGAFAATVSAIDRIIEIRRQEVALVPA